ncbi:hypothetical protein ISN45_Aa06g022650 [Arabidopsis thaliana x Arabidopsis arenosa]|uniref:Uncharacterized protein n=1 Tax=Arabidopsis thaliana x Arabidopsis arenosa TaxID=1240361 RepID=A0A8T1YYE1_9BRAS|nr:hypothetical protein ISN45_Aa06g022650 [Arabidopsis thaliana x Arabidopsis arenosa]
MIKSEILVLRVSFSFDAMANKFISRRREQKFKKATEMYGTEVMNLQTHHDYGKRLQRDWFQPNICWSILLYVHKMVKRDAVQKKTFFLFCVVYIHYVCEAKNKIFYLFIVLQHKLLP